MRMHPLRFATWAALLALLAWPCAGLAQEEALDEGAPRLEHRLWLEAGAGLGQMSFESTPYAEPGTGFSLALTAGLRITPNWSAGLLVGGVGLKPSDGNYDPYNYGSTIWGESVTTARLLAEYQPDAGRGWFYGGGAGLAYYHNKPLEDRVGRTGGRIGDGSGFIVCMGYDWPHGARGHVRATFAIDTGSIGLDAPPGGSLRYTAVSALLSYALR